MKKKKEVIIPSVSLKLTDGILIYLDSMCREVEPGMSASLCFFLKNTRVKIQILKLLGVLQYSENADKTPLIDRLSKKMKKKRPDTRAASSKTASKNEEKKRGQNTIGKFETYRWYSWYRG